MEFRILGPLETYEAGKQVPVGGAKQKALLAMLLLNGNQVVRARLYPSLYPIAAGAGRRDVAVGVPNSEPRSSAV
jgi:hypothetical protein